MIRNRYRILLIVFATYFLLPSCEDFVELEPPNYKMVAQTVFEDDETAIAAVTGIYNELFSSASFANGNISSVTVLGGLSSDIFTTTSATDLRYGPFQQNQISPSETQDASANYELWSSAYNIVYMANAILEGSGDSVDISEETRTLVEGQALFIRAFTYFYLVNLYGDVPLILTTDYRQNAIAPRTDASKVLERIKADLDLAIALLDPVRDYTDMERTQVNLFVALALRARVSLYEEDWEQAGEFSSLVIAQTALYEILGDLDQVFLKNSREAIWQISPVPVGSRQTTYTSEGYFFRGINSSPVVLSDVFIEGYDLGDKRLSHWVGLNDERDFFFPQKYKDGSSRGNITEYSMVLRLAEQYLIRAEARAMQGNLSGAIADLDKIRERAGLTPLAETDPEMGQQALLDMIMEERKRELFSEWGHRWLDLKRTRKAGQVLSPIKPQWQGTDILYPIPGEERAKNPNIGQNGGY
ncbi:MAG: RagB/SusD family nutrient uptake outer membrane protein [Sediminicola sp.]